MAQTLIVDVLLPVPVNEPFSYSVTGTADVLSGCRVIVPFGKRKHLTGIILNTHAKKETAFELKEITEILDNRPIVTDKDIQFWHWIADYYMCSIGEVMQAALPGGLLVKTDSILTLNTDYIGIQRFSGNEARIYEWLSANKRGELKQIEKALGIKNTFKSIRNLLDASAIVLEEKLREKYKSKKEVYVRLKAMFKDEEVLDAFFESLKRAPVQEQLLIRYFSIKEETKDAFIPRQMLTSGGRYAAYKALLSKGVFTEHEVEVSRLEETLPVVNPNPLTDWQEEGLQSIRLQFKSKSVVLLKGASASGKTEIYTQLIKEQIEAGKQVLMLVPEISLTTQLSKRFKRVFGANMAIYHSRFNFNKRTELWTNVSGDTSVPFVLGARSALFLPFNNLGLIIIDEEHESSLKQHDPAPRYLARDAAIVLARSNQAKVLLGSATPSVESYHNALNGKYGFTEITQRYGKAISPAVKLVDLNQSYKKKKIKYHFSFELLDEIRSTLALGKQVILFQNRRGYAPIVECRTCGWVQKCKSCDVPMTWHFDKHLMACHYCGKSQRVISTCPSCAEEAIMNKGFGTEKVEAEIKEIFPESIVRRFDADAAGGLKNMEKLLTEFEEGDIDILVGTQMISRGLDFENVAFVGVLNADNLLNFPDFRASERALQMLLQVAGRAGRRSKQGRVLIQTHQAEHPVIQAMLSGQYKTFINTELDERKLFKYPPFNRIVDISIRHYNQKVVRRAASLFAGIIREELGCRVLGPETPGINKIKNLYHERIVVKSENTKELKQLKQVLIKGMKQTLKQSDLPKNIGFVFNVDPV